MYFSNIPQEKLGKWELGENYIQPTVKRTINYRPDVIDSKRIPIFERIDTGEKEPPDFRNYDSDNSISIYIFRIFLMIN